MYVKVFCRNFSNVNIIKFMIKLYFIFALIFQDGFYMHCDDDGVVFNNVARYNEMLCVCIFITPKLHFLLLHCVIYDFFLFNYVINFNFFVAFVICTLLFS